MSSYLIGIDVGGTKVFSELFDSSLKSVATDHRSSGFGSNQVSESIIASISTVLAKSGVESTSIDGIGIGIPGQVDSETGTVINAANLGIDSLDLGEVISHNFGLMPRLMNDVNATAVGLAKSHQPSESLVYLNFGTGLAAGILIDGQLLSGASSLAGEIGHISVDPNGAICTCSQRGCLETMSSAAGIREFLASQGHRSESWRDFESLPNPVRSSVGGRFIEGMLKAINVIALSVDPDYLYLGGGTLDLIRKDNPNLIRIMMESKFGPSFLASSGVFDRVRFVENHSNIAAMGSVLSLDTKA